MKLEAELKQPEIVALLKNYGFQGLHLKDHKERAYTYTFDDLDVKRLKRVGGDATITSNGKVAVYTIPGAGQLGVAAASSMVRFIDKTTKTSNINDSHVSKILVPDELHTMFLQAAANENKRVAYMKKLWQYLNQHKFHGRMDEPKLISAPKSPFKNLSHTTRGAYSGGPGYTAGVLWMNSMMFNAREPFFLETMLHEMAHQAVWQIDNVSDRTEKGHGPNWKTWMRNVGIKPSRYDVTEDAEYQVGPARDVEEEKLEHQYGPRAPLADVKKLVPIDIKRSGLVKYVYKGRIFTGHLDVEKRTFSTGTKAKMFTWKFPAAAFKNSTFYEAS
jgi:predicted SprT family Zn-dependent metalloprotease